MGAKSSQIRAQLDKLGSVSAEAHAAFMKAEDGLAAIEEREGRREGRQRAAREELASRYPALGRR